MNFIKAQLLRVFCLVLIVTIISCQGQSYSLQVDYPLDGKIFINNNPLQNWLTRQPEKLDEITTLYFLDLSKQRYSLRIELSDGSIIDTSFTVYAGESYYGINLRTGELYGFE